ncbi:MAG: protein kinase [Polyangia bacterium]
MSGAPESRLANLAGAAILVVDATPSDARQLSVLLHRAGCRVSVAYSADQARQRIDSVRPDLVLSEVALPGPDGFALCRTLKQSPALRLIPVVFLSARARPADKLQGFAAGAVDYVVKPFLDEELLARMNAQLAVGKLQAALEQERAVLAQERAASANLQDEAERSQKQLALVFSALSELLPGRILDGKYRIDSLLGRGGFGVVYKAEQVSLRRQVAVKVFLPSPGADQRVLLERFKREGMSAGRLNHPNVVSVFELGQSVEGIPYLAMELMSGRTLREEMNASPPLPLERVYAIIEPICDALATAHAANVIHRDIKPENIFLHQAPTGEVVKILDFGIALLRSEGETGQRELAPLTKPGHLLGTPSYMAPERLRTDPEAPPVDGRTDVFSVGVMAFEMLTGRTPFGGDRRKPMEVLVRQLTAEPMRLRELVPELPEPLEELIARTLRRDPRLRPSASELLASWRALPREAAPRIDPMAQTGGIEVADDPTQRVDTEQVELELPVRNRSS